MSGGVKLKISLMPHRLLDVQKGGEVQNAIGWRQLGWIDSNVWKRRLTAAMTASASFFQKKGFISWLCSAMKWLTAACRLVTEQNTLCFGRRPVCWAKNPSTALSQEQEVGAKWKVQRGWWGRQARTFARSVACPLRLPPVIKQCPRYYWLSVIILNNVTAMSF